MKKFEGMRYVPEDLMVLVTKTFGIKRFDDPRYPDIFEDNVGIHILRCLDKVAELPLVGTQKELVSRILAVHDLPEIIIGDVTNVIKLEKGIDLEDEELAAAHKLLKPEDVVLLVEFNKAKLALEGERMSGVLPEAVIAKIIDANDADARFHIQLVKWMVSDKYDARKLPPRTALDYSFDRYYRYMTGVRGMPIEGDWKQLGLALLDQMIRTVIDWWSRVPGERVPMFMVEKLAQAEGR